MKNTIKLTAGLFGIIAIIALGAVRAAAAAPANDNFASAQTLTGLSGTINATTLDAGKQTAEPCHASNCGGASVWYKYFAPGTGVMTLDTKDSDVNSLLAVYRGTGFGDLELVAANDDNVTASTITTTSRVVFGTQAGVTYYIAIDSKRFFNAVMVPGAFVLQFAFANVAENDNFSPIPSAYRLSVLPGTKVITTTNVGASKEANEPDHAGNAGGKSIWFGFSGGVVDRSFFFTLEGKSLSNQGMNCLFALYKGNNLNSLVPVASTVVAAGRVGRLTLATEPNATYYLAVDGFDNGSGATTGNFQLSYGTVKSRKHADFDRDGLADITVYRPTTGTFYSLDTITKSLRAYQWGANGDKPLLDHWEDDERPDYTVYRPDTQIWHVNFSSNAYLPFNWGLATDIPLTLDHYANGSSKCYPAVFRPSTGTWYIRTYLGPIGFQFGQNGDIPMTIDVDGNGTDEVAVFRPSNGTWYYADPLTGAFLGSQQFGLSGDRPVPADYDGDGKVDFAVFRPSTGTWYILQSESQTLRAAVFGLAGDKPQPADFSGDGFDDIAVFRPSTGTWWILRSGSLQVQNFQFGLSGDIPVSTPIY